MSMQQNIKWSSYEFEINLPDADWLDVPGIYIFSKLNENKRWVAMYIGQADSLKERFSNHEKWDEAKRKGMTRIHAMHVAKQADRDAIEEDLIKKYQPPMNTLLK